MKLRTIVEDYQTAIDLRDLRLVAADLHNLASEINHIDGCPGFPQGGRFSATIYAGPHSVIIPWRGRHFEWIGSEKAEQDDVDIAGALLMAAISNDLSANNLDSDISPGSNGYYASRNGEGYYSEKVDNEDFPIFPYGVKRPLDSALVKINHWQEEGW